METVDLDLSTLGRLNEEVRALLPSLVNALSDDGDKARLAISIEIKRVKDTETTLTVADSVKPSFPKKAQVVLCRRDLVENLRTDMAEPRQKTLFATVEG
jgi:hypothetical protein